ncbi:peptidase, M24 family protein, partial [gut metagenome]
YAPNVHSNAVLTDGLLLIDSGGQYETGTTDITRMTAVGQLSAQMRRDVTIVLKAMIALARGVFPIGATGAQLDAVARMPLWREGLDFGHGTGHGVGFVLNVHEGPFRISPYAVDREELGLQPGLVVSDEPGLYRPGQWGVRLENLITAGAPIVTEFGRFLPLETLTLCPFDRRTLEISLLNDEEIRWIDEYHRTVRSRLLSRLSPQARDWLIAMTEPLRD